jgi:hypothetical protein
MSSVPPTSSRADSNLEQDESPPPAIVSPSALLPSSQASDSIKEASVSTGVSENTEEQPLDSDELIELQSFSERKAWIEEKIEVI